MTIEVENGVELVLNLFDGAPDEFARCQGRVLVGVVAIRL